jgi:hypothetical protein
MSEITVALQSSFSFSTSSQVKVDLTQDFNSRTELRERTRAKVKKAASKSEVNLEVKPNGENVENAEKEGGKKNKITRVYTAPAKLGKSKEKTDEWGELHRSPLTNLAHLRQRKEKKRKEKKRKEKKRKEKKRKEKKRKEKKRRENEYAK